MAFGTALVRKRAHQCAIIWLRNEEHVSIKDVEMDMIINNIVSWS